MTVEARTVRVPDPATGSATLDELIAELRAVGCSYESIAWGIEVDPAGAVTVHVRGELAEPVPAPGWPPFPAAMAVALALLVGTLAGGWLA